MARTPGIDVLFGTVPPLNVLKIVLSELLFKLAILDTKGQPCDYLVLNFEQMPFALSVDQ